MDAAEVIRQRGQSALRLKPLPPLTVPWAVASTMHGTPRGVPGRVRDGALQARNQPRVTRSQSKIQRLLNHARDIIMASVPSAGPETPCGAAASVSNDSETSRVCGEALQAHDQQRTTRSQTKMLRLLNQAKSVIMGSAYRHIEFSWRTAASSMRQHGKGGSIDWRDNHPLAVQHEHQRLQQT